MTEIDHVAEARAFVDNLPNDDGYISAYTRNGVQYRLTAEGLRAVLDEVERLRAERTALGVGEHYRLPHGGGYCVSCRRPMREGMLVVRATAPQCLLCTGEVAVPQQPERGLDADGAP